MDVVNDKSARGHRMPPRALIVALFSEAGAEVACALLAVESCTPYP